MTQTLFFLYFLQSLIIIICILISVAFFTLGERKIMATIQGRRGPNVIGYLGLLQPLADGLKLFCKEIIFPSHINKKIFSAAPFFAFCLSALGWIVIPFEEDIFLSNMELGNLFLLAISSLSVYSILLAGWSSNSKYAFLGGLRSLSQMISYEISIGFIVLSLALCAGTYNLNKIVISQINMFYFIPLFPLFLIFLVSILAETNRHPFDLAEAESELVSGFNVEYSGMPFAFFFLAEYSNMLLMSAITSTWFLGGWLSPWYAPFDDANFKGLDLLFIIYSSSPKDKINYESYLTSFPIWLGLKISLIAIYICAVRAVLPRFRYDQLMHLGWKIFFPLSISFFIIIASILISFNSLLSTI